MRYLLKFLTVAGALSLVPATAHAQQVTVAVPAGYEELQPILSDASLSVELRQTPEAVPADYVAAATADYRRMLRALYGEGYYAGVISITLDGREVSQIPPDRRPAHINQVLISVAPGPEFRLGRTTLSPTPSIEMLERDLREDLAPGSPARARVLRDATEAVVQGWRELGYAKARVAEQEIIADHRRNLLNVSLQVAPGPKLRFGDLRAAGNRTLSQERIAVIAGLPYGDLFDPEELERATRRLRRTGVFDTVVLQEAEQWTPEMKLPITARLSERKPRRIGAGIEYSTSDGLRLTGFWMHRNLLGGAERLRITAEVSELATGDHDPDAKLGISLSRPATFGKDNTLVLDSEVERREDPDELIEQVSFGVGIQRFVNEKFTFDYGIEVRAAHEDDLSGKRDYRLVTLPLEASYDQRDDTQDPKSGYYAKIGLIPFWGFGDVGRGLQLKSDLRGYISPGNSERLTLAGRLQLGQLRGVTGRNSPADYRFFSGGGGTVRGHRYKSLGIETPRGTLGGYSFTGVQAEVRGRITEKFGAAGFIDAGHIGRRSAFLQDGDWHAGVGLGVRYMTPLGPIRLDVATPANGDGKFDRTQIYIGIGQSF